MNAITLRSGKELGKLEKLEVEEEPRAENEVQITKGRKYEIPMKRSKEIGDNEKKSTYVAPPAYDPPIP